MKKNVFIATSAFIDFMIDLTRSFVYYGNGYITKDILIYLPFLIVIGWIGTYLGKRILHHIPQKNFRALSLTLILLIGMITLLKVAI